MKKGTKLFIIAAASLALLLGGAATAFAGGRQDAQAGEKITMIMATASNPGDSIVESFFQFEKLVEERSGGKIDVDIKHSGQLGGQRDYLENLQMGSIQAAEITSSVLTSIDEKYGCFDLPYISRSVAHLQTVMDAGLAKILTEALESKTGIRNIGYAIRSPRSMYNSLRPIVVADDFNGMKVRIMESPVMTRTFQLLGAVPVPLAATERYMALQTKVVDAAENSVPLIITQKEYEVTKYVSLTEHFITVNCTSVDTKFLNKLSADLNKIIADAGIEAAQFGTKLDSDSEAAALKKLEELGMTVNKVPDKSSFQKKVAPIYAEYRDKIGGAIIDMFTK
ncbi:MAG: TRAP transporter substrate-binding protein [Spirochaetales bacterium]|jgi:tripartite ATP-independent transporter DctP family solute receptor|nr:TRAP transporter substrate-binding protein [Spirochaetales bacterium]